VLVTPSILILFKIVKGFYAFLSPMGSSSYGGAQERKQNSLPCSSVGRRTHRGSQNFLKHPFLKGVSKRKGRASVPFGSSKRRKKGHY